ncbi:MAG: hypothetical protein AAF433_08910 [Bacteroidota bacterium]
MSKTYPAKVLLFGEHTVLRGSQALAIPYPRFSAHWAQGRRPDLRLQAFARDLRLHLQLDWLDYERLEADLKAGWYLESTVPSGYGLGSSGTVCAAIYDRYCFEAVSPNELRRRLASMETHFHGSSSGTDPYISFTQEPILIEPEEVRSVELPQGWQAGFFLLDTGQEREAGPIIADLSRRYDIDADWQQLVDEQWTAPTNEAIDRLLSGKELPAVEEDFRRSFRRISDFQLEHLWAYIPRRLQDLWNADNYCLKLCGAGGGGFVLGYQWGGEWPIPELVAYPHFSL